MDKKGNLIVQVFTSGAQVPIKNATVSVTTPEEENPHLLYVRFTDSSGRTQPLEFDSPPEANSQSPGNSTDSFSSFFVRVDHPEFETALVKDVQIFSNQITLLPVEMIPLPENAKSGDKIDTVLITPQNL